MKITQLKQIIKEVINESKFDKDNILIRNYINKQKNIDKLIIYGVTANELLQITDTDNDVTYKWSNSKFDKVETAMNKLLVKLK